MVGTPASPAAERAAALSLSGLITTWFGVGLLPGPRGTWGTFAAVPVAWAIQRFGGPWALLVGAVVVTAIGIWSSHRYAARLGVKDPSSAVIDEVAGLFLMLSFTPAGLVSWTLGVVLFRVLDIWKPWPARVFDRDLPGGLGIVLDDVMSGAYGLLLMGILGRFL
jgi:phosphatidylglycerophosphatase A